MIAATLAIVLGIALRFVQLPSRALFSDEAITQIRVAGYSEAALYPKLYDGRPRTASAVRALLRVDGTSTPVALVQSLEREDAQHPPLFYLAEQLLVRVLGDSLTAWRVFAAVCGCLSIAAAYVLGRAVFGRPRPALLGAAFFAVSPVQRLYSNQCREYSLFVLVVLVATIAVETAVRTRSRAAWAAYALSVALGLYTSPFMLSIVLAHAVFVAASLRRSDLRLGWPFVAAVAAALVAFVPWLHVLIVGHAAIEETNAWSAGPWPPGRLVAKWAFNLGTTFFDLEYLDIRWTPVFIAVCLAAAGGVVLTFRRVEAPMRWLLGTLALVPALVLAVPDIILGEHRSGVTRYELPVFAALSIAAGGLVRWPRTAGAVLAAASVACAVSSVHDVWWDNDANVNDRPIAAAVDGVSRPYLVTRIGLADAITLNRDLSSETRLVLIDDHIADEHILEPGPVFVLNPTPADRAEALRRLGWTLRAVPYGYAVTAHDIGARLTTPADSEVADGFDLFRVVTGRDAIPPVISSGRPENRPSRRALGS